MKLFRQCSPHQGVFLPRGDAQTLGAVPGRDARLVGTGNVSELLINAVMINMPKLLLGMNQTVRGQLFLWDVGTRRYQGPRWKGRP